MRETRLLLIALAWSLIGISILFAISVFILPDNISTDELPERFGETITIQGEVVRATHTNSANFIDLKDSAGKITVVFFEDPEIEVEKYNEIVVTGVVQKYKGKFEVIAREIVCLNCG